MKTFRLCQFQKVSNLKGTNFVPLSPGLFYICQQLEEFPTVTFHAHKYVMRVYLIYIQSSWELIFATRKDYTLFESLTQVGQIPSIISIMAEGINLARNTYLVHSWKYNISLVLVFLLRKKAYRMILEKDTNL